ncbi:MAG: flagellin FliC [Gammaproteobacteria bacterium]|jgi:flagellin|nr:flagellin FliC [Gammaproteobacteria bacterium]
MSVINTNITSLIAQQNLNKSQNELTTAMERLSSGMRINSAKDDAAGQAIANRFTAQINGLNQAVRNSNDGISIAQTTEGSLNQINDNLQTIRTLTVQAQNGTNSDSDLQSIQDEINQRLDEIDRISQETDFNGTRVLAEGADALRVQVGANDDQIIDIGLRQIDVSSLGLTGFNVDQSGTPNTAATETNLLAQGFSETATPGEFTNANFNNSATVADVFANITQDGATVAKSGGATYTYDSASNSFSFDQTNVAVATAFDADLGLTPDAGETTQITVSLGGVSTEVTISSSGTLTNTETGQNLYLTGTAGTKDLSETSAGGTQATIDALVTELGAATTAGSITTRDGTVYSANTGNAGNIDTQNESIAFESLQNEVADTTTAPADITIDLDGSAGTTADVYVVSGGTGGVFDDVAGTNEIFASGFEGSFELSQSSGATVYLNDNGLITDGAANQIYVQENGNLTMEARSGDNATEDPLATLDAALANVDSLRSELGAVQNRFSDAIFNLETNALNLSDARSRIEDADYAKEVAEMTRAQILQQAGTSVLAQANQLPQNVLSLLG